VATVSDQGQLLVGFRSTPAEAPAAATEAEAGAQDKRRGFRLPSLRRRSTLTPTLSGATRQERAEAREREKEMVSAEAAKEAFFETPAGRARLAYKRGHQLFQYELETGALEPTAVPGPVGSPARETTDPVDILNSVAVEGWKLVTGKFFYSEMRGGVVGCYLFKRSQKRRLAMNNPWQAQG
jgi:hypothetical protein